MMNAKIFIIGLLFIPILGFSQLKEVIINPKDRDCATRGAMINSLKILTNENFRKMLIIEIRNKCYKTIVATELIIGNNSGSDAIKRVKVKIQPNKIGQIKISLSEAESNQISQYGNYNEVMLKRVVYSDGETGTIR